MNYKWNYEPKSGELTVWEVDSPAAHAVPMHMDKFGSNGMIHNAQGRIREDGLVTVYHDRPYDGTYSAEECGVVRDRAVTELQKWAKENKVELRW